MPGLHISELTLSFFRSHRSAQLVLDPRPVAIYGPNGAGKTNLIEAVSLLSPGRGLRRAAAQDMARRPEALGWKVTSILNSRNRLHEVETISEGIAARQVRIDGKPAPQVTLARIVSVLWLVPSMDRLWIEGSEGRRRFLDRITMSFIPGHAEVVLDYDKAMRERNRLLKDQVRDAHWYLALERQMALAGEQINTNRQTAMALIADAQRQAETAFPVANLDLVQTEGEMHHGADDLREAFAESRFRDLMAARTLIGPHRADLHAIYAAKDVPAAECSTGEQKALLVSLILANSRALARDFGAPPILLLDEVAAHLDAGRRTALYEEICALGSQAWMTGTEPDIFKELGERAQYVEVTETDGGSRISRKVSS